MCHAGGFSLIEVLIALLVLAIGITGAAGTQVASLRTRHGTSLLSQATELAGSLADRMRANAAVLRAGDDNPYSQLRYDAAADGPPAAGPSCFGGNACDAAQMAEFDVAEVRAALHALFPGGRIVVCRDRVAAHGAALSWDCAGGPGAPLVIKLGWRGKEADGKDELDASGVFAPALALAVEVGP